ncbi:hypothetical protein P9443_17715 [Peribacillus frigoritolerans]|uniref:hypothetical protein n=1 Tax=Peribacillus frigoritolerans TaxID=450367 RepID=UPI002E1A5080|nr:hypothetical protein [Peribacillus frigoritolerans]
MYSVDIIEVSKTNLLGAPAKITELGVSPITGMNMSFLLSKLAFNIAMSISFENITPILYYRLDMISSRLIEIMINKRCTNFRLISDPHLVFKDFSFSSRIGEVGQGLTRMFVQEILNQPFCINFEDYIARRRINVPNNQSRSDFIYIDFSKRERGLIDSKATFFKSIDENGNDLKGVGKQLRDGLNQCKNINSYINKPTSTVKIPFHKYGCSCIKFHDSNSVHNTKILYVDPVIDSEKISDEELFEDVLLYYLTLLEKINPDNVIEINRRFYNYETANYGGHEFYIIQPSDRLTSFINGLTKNKKKIIFGISTEIIKYIIEKNLDFFSNYDQIQNKFNRIEPKENYEIFKDGTVLAFK